MENTNKPAERFRQSEEKLDLLVQTGLNLSRNPTVESIAETVSEALPELCGAQVAVFSHDVPHPEGESRLIYAFTQSGCDPVVRSVSSKNSSIPFPRIGAGSAVRSTDIATDSRFSSKDAGLWFPEEFSAIRSYLAVPAIDRDGKTRGSLFCGHSDAGAFDQRTEELATALVAQATAAIENIHLKAQLAEKIMDVEKARQELHDSSKRSGELAAIVASSDDAIISKDLTGVITSWNRAATRILGYSEAEMIGQSILKLIPEHLHGDEPVILGKIRSGERIDHFETIRRTKSGELIDVALTVSPIRDSTGRIVGASKILRDISSNKRVERSLLQAEKMAAAGRMAATIAHEINNPLEAVINLLYLLRDSVHDPEGADYLQTAENEVTRVSHIARQTLGFYREHGAARKTSLAELVRHTIAVYEPRCTASAISLESSLHTDRQLILRRGEIMQVVSNLVANAIYAMPDGGNLKIVVEDMEEGVLLSVRDTGVGIAENDLPRVFDAFFTTRASIGTGIGLFVSRQFVEGHGGSITIESSQDKDRHGTVVSVFLPNHTVYEGISDDQTSSQEQNISS